LIALAAARAARLRPQHAEAGRGHASGDPIKILRIAATRRQQNHHGSAALGDHLDAHIIMGDDLPAALGVRRDGAERSQTD
jgi:hypothetical protein